MESRLVLLTFGALLFIGQASSLFFGTPVSINFSMRIANLRVFCFRTLSVTLTRSVQHFKELGVLKTALFSVLERARVTL